MFTLASRVDRLDVVVLVALPIHAIVRSESEGYGIGGGGESVVLHTVQ